MKETTNSIIYLQERKVSASFMDCTAKLGLSHAAGMIQDNLTECFGALGADNYRFNKENFPAAVFEEKFNKFDFETTDEDFVYSQQVRCQLMDMSNHLNNIEYVKMGVGVLDADFIKSHEIKDMEVHYMGECKEFQELKIYKTEKDGKIYVRIKESERTVFEMSMSFYMTLTNALHI